MVLKNLIRLLFPVLTPLSFDKGGSPPAAPPAPDPSVQIAAEAKTNRYNVLSPFGTQQWSQMSPNTPGGQWDEAGYKAARAAWDQAGFSPDTLATRGELPTPENFGGADTWTQKITLDPSQQRQFDARNQIAEQMLGRASTQMGKLPAEPFAFNAKSINPSDARSQELVRRLKSFSDTPWSSGVDGTKVSDAVYAKAKRLLDPTYGRMQEQLDQKLVNQGLPLGSEAFGQANDIFGRERSNAYETAALDAVTQGANEEQNQFGRQLSTRQQNVNEVLNALSGSQSQFGADYGREYGADQDSMARQLTERQQQYNELAALMGGQQLNPLNATGGGVDTAGAFANQQAGVNRAYQGDLAGYNAGVSRDNSTTAAGATLGAAAIALF